MPLHMYNLKSSLLSFLPECNMWAMPCENQKHTHSEQKFFKKALGKAITSWNKNLCKVRAACNKNYDLLTVLTAHKLSNDSRLFLLKIYSTNYMYHILLSWQITALQRYTASTSHFAVNYFYPASFALFECCRQIGDAYNYNISASSHSS